MVEKRARAAESGLSASLLMGFRRETFLLVPEWAWRKAGQGRDDSIGVCALMRILGRILPMKSAGVCVVRDLAFSYAGDESVSTIPGENRI